MLSYISHPQLMKDGTVIAIGHSSDSRKTIYHIIDNDDVKILGRNRWEFLFKCENFSINPDLLVD